MESLNNDLMNALATMNSAKVIELSSKNKSKKYNFSFAGYLENLGEEDLENLWKLLANMVIKLVEEAFESHAEKPDESFQELYPEIEPLTVAAIDIVSAGLEMKRPISLQIFSLTIFLNVALYAVPSCIEKLRNNIAHLCEKVHQLSVRKHRSHYYLYNVIIYLITRSLAPKATESDVKRVYMLHDGFKELLTMDVERTKILELFKKCASSKLYLQTSEGFEIISWTMTLDAEFVVRIHEVIKLQLENCAIKTAISFGKAYFDAWSYAVENSKEDLKIALEYFCIENILVLGIKGQKKSVLNVRKFLSHFYLNKKETSVTKILQDLFQPVFWRYLMFHDGRIRSNATQLFLDAFPFPSPDTVIVASENHLNIQLLMIKNLLLNHYAIVRCSAVIGLCTSMSVNWELFPEEMLATYFKIIVDNLSCDSSSKVRCAVAKGIKVLLENPLTYPTLKKILPKLQGLFHDASKPVRIAFCQLLLRINTSGIKYLDIVLPEHLLARLEDDCHAVSKALVDLLSNSYFSKNTPYMCLLNSIELIKMDRSASRIFFQYITCFNSLETTVDFIAIGVEAIHQYVTSKIEVNKLCVLNPNSDLKAQNEKIFELEKTTNFQNMEVVKGIIDGLVIMWISSEQKLIQTNTISFKLLVEKLKNCLPDLLIYYKETTVSDSLYYLCSFIPCLCYQHLKQLPNDAKPKEYITLLKALCNRNASRELLQLLHNWIRDGIYNVSVPAKKRKVSTRKCIPVYKSEAKPFLATQMLNFLVNDKGCQKSLLNTSSDILFEMKKEVEVIKEKVEQINTNSCNDNNALVLKQFLHILLKISLLLHV